ncbi:MAG: MBL fold metallo-hydrolase, partial [Myxococcales bacterium]|nr:MBL fold metallo-hydrolase [Myxococcales bacterium]
VLLVAASALALLAGGRALLRPAELRAVFIDVGQGDATLLELAGGQRILVDGGGARRQRAGGGVGLRRVIPLLQRRRVRRLDLVVATHAHADHVRGLLAVLARVEVAELWTCAPQGEAERGWFVKLHRLARRRGVRVRVPRSLRFGDVRIEPLWPRAGEGGRCGDTSLSTNENSIVLRVDYGASRLLLTGDIERDAEAALLSARPRALRASVVKVPHHGSRTSSSAGFVEAVSPRLAVISCAQHNAFRFPAGSVLRRYRAAGARVVRTDRQGAVIVALRRDGTFTWRGTAGGLP